MLKKQREQKWKRKETFAHKSTRIRDREGDEDKKILLYLPRTLHVHKNVTTQKHNPCC
jgi:hypothetical protein